MSEPFLRWLNDKVDIAAAGEGDFEFIIPTGGTAKIKEITYHIFRNTAQTDPGEGGSEQTSEEIYVKKFAITKKGTSEQVDLIDGTPNIKEIAGDGKLAKILDPAPVAENNQTVTITLQNDDSVTCTISVTLMVEIDTIARKPAGQ